jgi:hypothetical protein
MPAAGIELAIPATKRPMTYDIDGAATGIGNKEMSTYNLPRLYSRAVELSPSITRTDRLQTCLLTVKS